MFNFYNFIINNYKKYKININNNSYFYDIYIWKRDSSNFYLKKNFYTIDLNLKIIFIIFLLLNIFINKYFYRYNMFYSIKINYILNNLLFYILNSLNLKNYYDIEYGIDNNYYNFYLKVYKKTSYKKLFIKLFFISNEIIYFIYYLYTNYIISYFIKLINNYSIIKELGNLKFDKYFAKYLFMNYFYTFNYHYYNLLFYSFIKIILWIIYLF